MQKQQARSASTHSKVPLACNHRKVSSHPTAVRKKRLSPAPSLVEQSANIVRPTRRDDTKHDCVHKSQPTLQGKSINRIPTTSSSVPTTTLQHVHKVPVFCSPYYRWSPLHTTCTHAVLEEHKAVIDCYEENEGEGGEACLDNEIKAAWLVTAKSRCDALLNFIQDHRSLYGSLDADKIEEIEICRLRLSLCVKKAERYLNLDSGQPSSGAFLDFTRSFNQPTVTRATKRISFARPLFSFFSSASTRESEGQIGSKLKSSRFSFLVNENDPENKSPPDLPYAGRTSGVYYGDISFSGDGGVKATPIVEHIHEDDSNASSSTQRQERLKNPSNTENEERNAVIADFSPRKPIITPVMLQSSTCLRKGAQGRQRSSLYRYMLALCFFFSFLIAYWWCTRQS